MQIARDDGIHGLVKPDVLQMVALINTRCKSVRTLYYTVCSKKEKKKKVME